MNETPDPQIPAGAGLPGEVSGRHRRPRPRQAESLGGALTRKLKGWMLGERREQRGAQQLSARRRREHPLRIRWFTPRGQELVEELLDDLRHGEGTHVGEIVAELRRPGARDGAPDLRGIDLRGADLAGSSLAGCDLRGAALQRSNLQRCDLRGAHLVGALLERASLRGARLERADLSEADLREADLSEADLSRAELCQARLERTDLRRACLAGVDLRLVDTRRVDLRQIRTTRTPPPARRPGARRRQAAVFGRPPASEPLRPSERRRGRPPSQRLSRRQSGVARPPLRRRPAPPAASFDAALVELLSQRDAIDEIRLLIAGEARLIYRRQTRSRAQSRAG